MSAGVTLLVGTRKGLFVGRGDDPLSVQLEPMEFRMRAVYTVGVDRRRAQPRFFVATDSEHWGPSIFHSDDGGTTWAEPDEAPIAFPDGTDASVARVWQVVPGAASEPDVVYAGVEPSALFRSEDGGVHFSLVRSLWDHPHRPQWTPGAGGQCLHTIVPHPTETDRVLVAMSTGGVYRTADGGASWDPSNTGVKAYFYPDPYPEFGQCVHRVASHPAAPERMYLQNHHGVYRSDDGGGSWQSIADGLPADFGFPILVHPQRPETAYVFPLVADAERLPPEDACRVYRTDDAGTTWTALTNGLPQQGFYAAVLRDAMCTDGGEQPGIYFGTRDGEVYASGDDGDSWTRLASHLPDVLSVRAIAA